MRYICYRGRRITSLRKKFVIPQIAQHLQRQCHIYIYTYICDKMSPEMKSMCSINT